MAARLWSLGVFLVVLGIAAHLFGWNFLLWFPRYVLDSLIWVPAAAMDMIRSSPATFGVIALGIVLMVVADFLRRRRG